MELQRKSTTTSFTNKKDAVIFVKEVLTKFEEDNTLLLTIDMGTDKLEDYSAIIVTINYYHP